MPLLGGLSAHVGGLDVPSDRVPLLAGVSAHVGGVDVPSDRVPLLGTMWSGAIASCHCLGGR